MISILYLIIWVYMSKNKRKEEDIQYKEKVNNQIRMFKN